MILFQIPAGYIMVLSLLLICLCFSFYNQQIPDSIEYENGGLGSTIIINLKNIGH